MKKWLDATTVGLGEHEIANHSGRLAVRGLGSCVAVILYDGAARVGGIAHVLLPSHTLARDQARPAKFADTAVPILLADLRQYGAQRERVVAKLVGGASMFQNLSAPGTVQMGERNVVACRTALRAAGVPVVGEDVGGEHGRSVLFTVSDGKVVVRQLGGADRHV